MYGIDKRTQEVHGITPDAIPERIYRSDRPVILRELVKDWPLVQQALESDQQVIRTLREHYSGKHAPVYFGEPNGRGRLFYNEDISGLGFSIRNADLHQVLDDIESTLDHADPATRYIASNITDIYFPGLREHNDLPFDGPYFEQNPLQRGDPLAGIWIGNKTLSPCHWDAQSNIACCVAGKRTFIMFPPDQVENLYPGPLDLNPGGPAITMVDFEHPDHDKYPRYRKALAHGEVAELEPGDGLFVPCMWWHQVQAHSRFNILINYWWNHFEKIRGQAMNALELAILSIRDRPIEEKRAWQQLFNYYVFADDDHAGAHLPEHAKGILGEIDALKARQIRAKLLNKLNR